jgi:pyruvate/2-oxoacid:ferredoxin oxidoreductase alpha subunit
MVYFNEKNPMPEDGRWLDILKNSRLSIIIENNATSQFARHLRAETGFVFKESINKYDGRIFLFEDLLKEIDAKIRGL